MCKISRFVLTCWLLILSGSAGRLLAQENPQQRPVPVKVPRGWTPKVDEKGKKKTEKLVGKEKALQGLSLSFDVYNFATRFLGSYGGPEAALRVNLWHTYFPVFEAGVGMTNHTDDETNVNYKTNAPYFRIGIDKNMLRDKKDFCRLYAGFRYGFSPFKYSVKAPPVTDPIWGGQYSLNQTGVSATWGWLEVGIGLDVRVWRNLHLGLGARYKAKLHTSKNEFSEPWYVPGYGLSGSHWALNYSVIFDLSRGNGKKKKAVQVTPAASTIKREKPETPTTPKAAGKRNKHETK